MKPVWLMIVVGLVVSAVGAVSAGEGEEVKTSDIPQYDGKPGEKIGDVRVNPKDGAEMVWVPAGEFLMGSTDEEISRLRKADFTLKAAALDDEKPQRKVYLDGYWIYRTEVTVGQYRRFCDATKRKMLEAPEWGWKDDHPIVGVPWKDARDYAEWAAVSLPTEAQWEKAARGTDGRMYPWGGQWPPKEKLGNFWDDALVGSKSEMANALRRVIRYGQPPLRGYYDGHAFTSPVGSYPAGASPYGCLDMAGNVWEWCADWYNDAYYAKAPSKNPQGLALGVEKVLRGGSWRDDSGVAAFRCARRLPVFAAYPLDNAGFRCAKTP